MPAGRGLALLADVPDSERGDRSPQPVIQRKNPGDTDAGACVAVG